MQSIYQFQKLELIIIILINYCKHFAFQFAWSNYSLISVMLTACLSMVAEMSWQLSSINDRKTLQVGNFRLDDRPNDKPNSVIKNGVKNLSLSFILNAISMLRLWQVPYKKSDAFLFEIFENICRAMKDYHVTKGKQTQEQVSFNLN